VVADVTPGDAGRVQSSSRPAAPDFAAQTAADLWIDRASEAVHVVATTGDGAVRYYHRPGGAAWADHTCSRYMSFRTATARASCGAGDGPLHLVRGSAEWVRDRGAAGRDERGRRGGRLGGGRVTSLSCRRSEGFAAPSALFVESPTYQDRAGGRPCNFAMCGQYQVSDGEVWQGVLE
jgi:hypothetical protein